MQHRLEENRLWSKAAQGYCSLSYLNFLSFIFSVCKMAITKTNVIKNCKINA
jgi:hypothetical protein